MKQTAVVTKLLPDGFAEVVVHRGTACGGNCASCGGGCGSQGAGDGNRVAAENSLGAVPGQSVIIESSTQKVMKAAAIAYIIPVLCLVIGYAVPALLGAKEGVCILCAFAALAAGVAGIVLQQKNRKPLSYRIVHLGEKRKLK